MELVAGGVIKKYHITIINSSFSVLIFFINLFDQIIKNQSLINRAHYTVPFLFFPIFFWIFRKKYKFNAYFYLGMSILAMLTTSETANLTGFIFLLFSLYIFQSIRTNTIILISTVIAICSKIFLGFSAMQIFALIIGYAYCLIIYYILIHPKKPNIYTGLDEITREIIEYKMAGWSTKQVADKVCLSTDAVQKRISRACDKYDAGNLAQLVYKLMKKGYIST